MFCGFCGLTEVQAGAMFILGRQQVPGGGLCHYILLLRPHLTVTDEAGAASDSTL